jgi:hypothetical protein
MKEIRLCWAPIITVVAQNAPVESTPWEEALPSARAVLEARVREANNSDGPDTFWIEERDQRVRS